MPRVFTEEEENKHHNLAHGFCTHGELRGDCNWFLGRLNVRAHRISLNAVAHGFHNPEEAYNFAQDCALIHSEVSEALECHRKEEPVVHYAPDGKPLGLGPELVQVIVRTLETLHLNGVDIDKTLAEVMSYDENRPYKHGNKRY